MKSLRKIVRTVLLHLLLSVSLQASAQELVPLRVASYNIRYAKAADAQGGNGWESRKPHVAELIRSQHLDIVGMQEGDVEQMAALQHLLPQYTYVAYPYGGPESKNHTAAILYKKDKFELLDQGVFWLSETPDRSSVGWDATDTRICTWAKLKERESGKAFYFFSAHFYYRYQHAREQSGPLMVRMIRAISGDELPIICTGDFNSRPETSQIQAVKGYLNDAFEHSETPPLGPENTDLGGGIFVGEPKARIDYIFSSKDVQVLHYVTLMNTYDTGRHPSDHLAVVCDLLF